jgi:hypothetical protein
MTFTIKVRGSAPMVAEYVCPQHGRFSATVDRDANGDPPATQACTVLCEDDNFPYEDPEECGFESEWVISAPIGRVKRGEASQGKYEPPPHAGYMDTRALGEGQSLDEWRADRAKVRQEQRIREIAEVMKS